MEFRTSVICLRCYSKVPEICLPELNHLTKIFIHIHLVWSSPLPHWYSDPNRISMVRSTNESNFTMASSLLPAIRPGSLHCSPLNFNFNFRNNKRIKKGKAWWVGWLGDVSRFCLSQKLPPKQWRGWAHCYGAGPRNCCATWMDVWTGCFRTASEHCNRSSHSQSWWNRFLMHDAP